jgi:hypothetical protein
MKKIALFFNFIVSFSMYAVVSKWKDALINCIMLPMVVSGK